MNKIYILVVSGGAWDDTWQYNIRAYSNIDLANKHCEEAAEYLQNYKEKNTGRRISAMTPYNNPQDSLTKEWDYYLEYTVESVDFYL